MDIDTDEAVLESLRKTLPAVFTRKYVEEMTGGWLRARTLANLDSKKGKPP